MRFYKYILLGLLFLISLSLIFTNPGIGNLEKFDKLYPSDNLTSIFIQYPPGVYMILNSILNYAPVDKSVNLFSDQDAFLIFKIVIFVFYILTWVALVYLKKSNNEIFKISLIDLTIAYFGSVSMMLISVALGFFEIFAAPFIILSLAYLLKGNFSMSGMLYFLSLIFSWSLLILAPPFLIYFLKKAKVQSTGIIPLLTYLIVPLLIGIYFLNQNLPQHPIFPRITSHIFSLPLLINDFLFSIFEIPLASKIINLVSYLFIGLFSLVLIYVLRLFMVKGKVFSKQYFITICLVLFFSFIIVFPGASEGNFLWLILFSLILFLFNPNRSMGLELILVNLLSFTNIFYFFGTAGIPPVRGIYFEFFRLIIHLSFLLFVIWFIGRFIGFRFFKYWPVKTFLVVFLIIINFSLIPAEGSSDVFSWRQYSQAALTQPNPFRAYTDVILQYPPVSMIIFSFFAYLWSTFLGFTQDIAIATKISIFIFYSLTVLVLFKSNVILGIRNNLNWQDKLLIILTTFSLIIQTQGLADVNIYVIPTLVASIISLYRKKYFLSGLLLGLTVSIKWQPIILIPIFLATVLNFHKTKSSIKSFLEFILGLLLIPAIVWYLVLIQPNGLVTIERSFNFFFHGAAALSGQALNLNWIVTYVMHFFEINVESLEHLGGLNRQIGTDVAPLIFQGFLFIVVFTIIFFKFWIFQKKNILNFLSASVMIFFSHFMLNKSAYEKHLFYVVFLMLLIYLVRPNKTNRFLLILFDIMTVMNLIFFYGFTGPKDIPRLFFGFDMTVLFAIYYVLIYLWIIWNYLKGSSFFSYQPQSDKELQKKASG